MNPKYRLFKNNYQHYANQLLAELGRNCRAMRKRRQNKDDDSLGGPSQCYQENDSSSRWSFRALLSPLISFAIFHNVI